MHNNLSAQNEIRQDILNKLSTLPILQASSQWKTFSIRERIALINKYKGRIIQQMIA